MSDDLRKEIYEVLSQHPICVVATVNEQNAPEAAIVGVTADENLGLLFGRNADSFVRDRHMAGRPDTFGTHLDFPVGTGKLARILDHLLECAIQQFAVPIDIVVTTNIGRDDQPFVTRRLVLYFEYAQDYFLDGDGSKTDLPQTGFQLVEQ